MFWLVRRSKYNKLIVENNTLNMELSKVNEENKILKNKISSLNLDKEGAEDSITFYMNKYRMLCDVLREIYNGLSDENDQIPEKCTDCNGELFYEPIGHYGICLKCGKSFNMSKFWKYLNINKPEIPCNKCKYKKNNKEVE